jgi:hypothetical protein
MVEPGLILISEPPLIPVWFYSYSAVVYVVSAIISFLISYFAFRLYRMSSVKTNLFLSFGFLALGLAFSSLTMTSIYTYLYVPYLRGYASLTAVNTSGYNFYYLASFIAYLLFVLMYLPKKIKNRLLVLYVPLWYTNFTGFHIASALLIGYVLTANILNYLKKKSLNSFLVMFAFLTIEIFHLLLLLLPFNVTLYLAAHTFLVVGFSSLLVMLIRVSGK